MSVESRILNGICSLLYRQEYKKFTSPCDIKKIQTEYLLKLLKKNSERSMAENMGLEVFKVMRIL